MTLHKYVLPAQLAAQWMKTSLRQGPSLSLSRLAADLLNWDSFSFSTFANHRLDDAQILDFSVGGKVGSDAADSWLLDWLSTSSVMENSVLVSEDWRASPRSPFLEKKKMPTFFHGNEVYYFLKTRDPREFQNWRLVISNTVPSFFVAAYCFIAR